MNNPFAQVAFYFQVGFDLPLGAAEQMQHSFDDIAAAHLWNATILAVDIDPIAVQVTQENVLINRVGKQIRCAVSDGYKSESVQQFGECDVIIANILARPLVRFAPSLARMLKPGGHCVLSGLLVDQETMVFSAHRLQGLKLVKRFRYEGWSTLVLQK